MKKILNGLGVLGSVILTVILSILIFAYVLLLNIKFAIGRNGVGNTFKNIDIVETLKNAENGVMWEDFVQLADSLNLSEEQFEQIINNDKVKEQIGDYIGNVLSSTFNDKEANLTKKEVDNFLNLAVDEYNKVSDTKISEKERKEIINSFNEEMISNMNEEFGSINLTETIAPEYIEYIELTDNLLYGNYTLILLAIILFIIGLIALLRFSYYKWIPYVKTSTVISGILILIVGLLLLIIPLQNLEILMPIKKLLVTRIFITSGILFILSIALSIGKKYIKKYVDTKKENIHIEENNNISEKKKEVKKVKDNNNKKIELDKKTIIIITLALILLIIILFLLFGKKGSYTITFDTNGGNEITSVEVKNNEIVKLPEPPVKENHEFIGWTNEEGKIITKGTKVTEDITLKAEWISNDAETITAEFDSNGGNEIDNIKIEKGQIILLPIEPVKDGYIFVGWLDENGNFITEETIITNNIVLKAMWIKKDAKISTIKFNTDGGSNVGNIIVEKGKTILLPVNPTKTGYVFISWVDENGKEITKDTIVKENMTIKATWKEPYTCPKGCTPIDDGSKCTKTSTTDIVTYTGCPNGTESVETFCSAHQRQVTVGFDEDMTYVTAGIVCNDNPKGFCVDYSGRYTTIEFSCPSGYYQYIQSDSGLDAVNGCAKKYDKGGSGCPSGYTKYGNKCTKTETLKCKAN